MPGMKPGMTENLMRRWLRPLWVVLALLFLLEAWLWDHLSPVVARIVSLIPWAALKRKLAQGIERLPPWATLIVFIVPLVLVVVPLKLLEVYFLATRHWLWAVAVLVAAKLIGVGVTAFVFDLTRDKLLQMHWFARLYRWTLQALAWAHRLTDPVKARIRAVTRLVLPRRAGRRAWRLMRRLRQRLRAA